MPSAATHQELSELAIVLERRHGEPFHDLDRVAFMAASFCRNALNGAPPIPPVEPVSLYALPRELSEQAWTDLQQLALQLATHEGNPVENLSEPVIAAVHHCRTVLGLDILGQVKF